jgi:Fic-DOC domain mobile mystery protein B
LVGNFLFKDRDGQTPLPFELQKGLIPKHIQTMGELDECEEDNIAEGLIWLGHQKQSDSTKHPFWIKLHKKLFANVWEWAGEIRKHELHNPDFHAPFMIWPAFKQLEGDLIFWLEKQPFPGVEMAARFHEKIETIHPFANGNGRFGRILVEHFCQQHGIKVPSWGAFKKHDPKARRKHYIETLVHCRRTNDCQALMQFMFS